MIWVYYIVLVTSGGIVTKDLMHFDSIEQCEVYMRQYHKQLKKEYYRGSEQEMTGSGCKRYRK